MEENLLEVLKQRHDYDAWGNRTTLAENLFIWKFFLSGDEFPDWQPQRIRVIEPSAPKAPLVIRSMWNRLSGDHTTLLNIEILALKSRSAAHEALLHLLGQVQSPQVKRQEQLEIGDVAFAGNQGTVLMFARANLVFLIRNAGRATVLIPDIVRPFDTDLSHQPPDQGETVPDIQCFESVAAGPELRARRPEAANINQLVVETSDPLDRQIMYRFFSRTGEVFVEDDQLVYQPASAGPQETTLCVVASDHCTTSRTLRFDAPSP